MYQYGPSNNLDGGHADIGWELAVGDVDTVSYTDIGSLASTAILFYNPLVATPTPTPTQTPTTTPTFTFTPTATPTATPHSDSDSDSDEHPVADSNLDSDG